MAREVHRLSAKAVEKIKQPGAYCDGGGLWLQVSPTLSKSWYFRYQIAGITVSSKGKRMAREMGLGSARDVSLAVARAKASDARGQLAAGVDPIAVRDGRRAHERLQKAGTISFSDCAEKYIAAMIEPTSKNEKHLDQWRNTIETYAGPLVGHLAVKDIDTALVLRVLEPIWTKKPETASRLRGRIERILGWATKQKYRAGENPARWRDHLDHLLPEKSKVHTVEHLKALPYKQIAAFMVDLKEQPGVAARAVELAILTAARSGEVRGAKRDEFDLDEALWIIPAERMKGKKEHRVPLSPRAVQIVAEQLKANPQGALVFPGVKADQPLSDMSLLAVLKRMRRKDTTVHGFRSTFRDWAAERTTYANHICEMALAHAIGDEVEAAYRRSDLFELRRGLMDDWARFCDTVKPAVVVPMKRKEV